MTDLSILGSKGESKQHTPVESPDSLINISYANILDGISEGPIVGLVSGAQSIYLDKTPLANSDGSLNFTGVTWEQRTGEHDQDHIAGFPAVESQVSVGVELKASQPWVQAFSNLELSAVRIQLAAGALVVTEQDGDRVGYKVAYEIDLSTDDSDYQVVQQGALDGKTTTGYQRSIRIDLPKAERGWRLRVRRTTPDSTTSNIQANTSIGTYTEIIDAKLQYPYTALCGLKIDASQFSAVPERAYRIRGRIIQVPSNYDPAGRTYSGTWDGTFKLAWTDCPAWIWRDIVLNDRYGLGRFIDASQVDKWALYQIAQYCDQLVSDGKGGQEPRFTCNVYLQSRADALTVLQDLASVFRGMSYYAGSQVACAADMPGDPVYTYTNANVIDGKFNRAGSSGSTRFSVAKVAWSDRENFGNQRVEYVQDQRSLARYGVRETEITAFGCVSQGQAQRAGQYILLTNRLETGTISFSVGLDGTICRPGDIIRVADEHYAGVPLAGRIKAATASSVTLDNDITAAAGDTLVVILPKGVAETRVIRSIAGREVTVTEPFSAVPVKESVYTIETAELVAETYRVLSVNENFGDDKLQYDIVAVARNDSKFDAIDNGAQIVIPPTSVLPAAVQAPPSNVQLSTFDTLNQGINIATMRITWDAPRGAQSYRVWWRRNNGDWIYAGVTYTAALEVRGIYTGTYTARVAAVGVAGNSSVWALSEPTMLYGKTGEPPAITSLTTESLLFGIGLKWTFPQGAEDTQRTELWYSEGTDLAAATKLADLAYPQSEHTLQGLRGGQRFFFWARLVDRSGNIGPWFPADGTLVSGMASMDAGPILEQIKDQITESELGKELTSKIELIDGNGPGSVNERVGTAKTELAKQISEVNNALASTKSNLQQQITSVGQSVTDAKAELQQQITAVSTLAGSLPYRKDKTYSINQSALGSDGKLYQALKAVPLNTPPPNATYWTDVGQAVVTANGIAARVSKVETDVSTLDGKTTAQASQIQSLQTSLTATDKNVAKKADATVVDSLTLRVSDAEGKLTSEGKRIDGLQTSLDGKASSTALQQVTARVTATEQKDTAQDQQLTSQSQALTSLTDSVSKKAEATTVQALSNDVKQQGQTLEAQGQSLTKINASLPFLSGENLLANSSFEDLIVDGSRPTHWAISGAAARSLVPSPLTSSLKALRVSANIGSGNYIDVVSSPVDGRPRVKVTEGVTYTLSVYARGSSALAYMRMYLQFLDASGTVLSAPTNADRIVLTDNFVRYTLTGTAPTAATQVNAYAARLFNDGSASTLLWMELDNVQLQEGLVSTAYQPSIVATADASAEAITGITGRVEKTEQGLSSTGQQITQLTNSLDTTNQNVAGAQKSAQEALSEVAKKADVSALQTLGSKVEQQGKDLASTGQAITRIDASIAASGSENLLFNPSFDNPSAGNSNIADGWTWRNTSGVAVTPTLRNSDLGAEGKCQRLDVAGLSADSGAQYVDFVPESGRRPPIYPGVAVTASIYIRGNSGLMVQIYLQFKDAAGNTLLTNGPTNSNLDPTYRRPFLISAVAPEGSVRVDVLYRIRSGPGSSVVSGFVDFDMAQLEQGTTLTGWRDNGKANAYGIAVNAAATSALTGRVEDNERGLTSTSGQLTQLENSIGDVGGENLFYNPAFTQYASANGSPEGWATEGPVTSTDTIVPSWLNSGEKAQRIVAPGLTSSNQYKSLRPVGSRRIKVSEGQAVTASVYARKSEGNIGMRIFIQWISSSDAVLGAPASNLTSLTTAGARLSFSAVAPAGAVEAYVYFRTYAMTATATNGTVEYARPQAEYGTRATGWRDNSQVVAAQQAVTSAAVESLNSTVSQQGNTLSSVSGRTTSLENAINSTSSGLATKASAESVSSLGNRVKQTEEGLSSQSSQVTQLKNSISGLQPFVAGRSWEFTGSTRGWVATETGSNFTAGPLFGTISKPSNLQCNFAPAISGAENPYLRVRLRRRNTSRSGAQMYWANEDGGLAEARRMAWTIDTTSTDWQDIEIDLAGHSGWNGKSITAIRLDMMNTANVSGEIDIAYIAVGRRSAAASAQALSSMESEVSQQGSKLTAETKRIDGLYASVDSANAAVQSEAKARADADSAIGKQMETVQSNLGSTNAAVQQISTAQSSLNGKVNASYTVRLQAMANGQWAMAGIGAGIDNNGGILQSTVAVIADRFAVMNPAGTGMILPFAIQNGQVVMNEALISKAMIQNAMVGSTIASAAMTNWGPPVLAIDFQSGLFRVHHPTKSGHYVSIDRNGVTLTAGGVNLVEMSFD